LKLEKGRGEGKRSLWREMRRLTEGGATIIANRGIQFLRKNGHLWKRGVLPPRGERGGGEKGLSSPKTKGKSNLFSQSEREGATSRRKGKKKRTRGEKKAVSYEGNLKE